MKCVIIKDQMQSASITGRIRYFKSLLRLYFIEQCSNDFITLTSVPSTCEDVCFIVGHQDKVKDYLERIDVKESTIVLICCDIKHFWNKYDFGGKEVFICKQDEQAFLYKKEEYSFGFDPTESELILFNSPRSELLHNRIENSFNRIR